MFQQDVSFLLDGEEFFKHPFGKGSKVERKFLFLIDEKEPILYWCTPGKRKISRKSSVIIKDVTQIFLGKRTEVFQRKTAVYASPNACFSLATRERTLDLQADSLEVCTKWVGGLRLTLLKAAGIYEVTPPPGVVLQQGCVLANNGNVYNTSQSWKLVGKLMKKDSARNSSEAHIEAKTSGIFDQKEEKKINLNINKNNNNEENYSPSSEFKNHLPNGNVSPKNSNYNNFSKSIIDQKLGHQPGPLLHSFSSPRLVSPSSPGSKETLSPRSVVNSPIVERGLPVVGRSGGWGGYGKQQQEEAKRQREEELNELARLKAEMAKREETMQEREKELKRREQLLEEKQRNWDQRPKEASMDPNIPVSPDAPIMDGLDAPNAPPLDGDAPMAPPMDGDAPPSDAPPMDGDAPPDAPPMEDGPPMDGDGPPMSPPVDGDGPPMAPPMDGDGPPMAPSMDGDGPPMAPPMDGGYEIALVDGPSARPGRNAKLPLPVSVGGKAKIKPGVKMKALHWKKLDQKKIKNTVWQDLLKEPEPQFDIKDFEFKFAEKPVEKKKTQS